MMFVLLIFLLLLLQTPFCKDLQNTNIQTKYIINISIGKLDLDKISHMTHLSMLDEEKDNILSSKTVVIDSLNAKLSYLSYDFPREIIGCFSFGRFSAYKHGTFPNLASKA